MPAGSLGIRRMSQWETRAVSTVFIERTGWLVGDHAVCSTHRDPLILVCLLEGEHSVCTELDCPRDLHLHQESWDSLGRGLVDISTMLKLLKGAIASHLSVHHLPWVQARLCHTYGWTLDVASLPIHRGIRAVPGKLSPEAKNTHYKLFQGRR